MRQIGTVTDERLARRFEDYLLTKGIAALLEPAADGWKIWIRHEDHLDSARNEFAAFTAAPDAPVYREAERSAQELRSVEIRRAKQARRNAVDVGARWRRGMVSAAPVTSMLAALSIAVFIFMNWQDGESVMTRLTIVPYQTEMRYIHYVPLSRNWYVEPWRLVTPIFLHFGLWHIVFNMMMLLPLGRAIELVRGSWRFALLVLVLAISSNVVQYVWAGPQFGGMSGVVYGLFGYIWMKSRFDPASGFVVSQNMVISMLAWFAFGLTGLLPVANGAHAGGLVFGMLIGYVESLFRRRRA